MSFRFLSAGVTDAYAAVMDSEGYLVGSTTTPPVNGNVTGAGPLRLLGVQTQPSSILAANVVAQTGDNGNLGNFIFNSTDPNQFTMTFGVHDFDFSSLLDGTKVDTTSGPSLMTMALAGPNTYSALSLGLLFTYNTIDKRIDTDGNVEWSWDWLGRCIVKNGPKSEASSQTPINKDYNVVVNQASRGMLGLPKTVLTNGATASIAEEYKGPYKPMVWTWRGDGTAAAFTLPSAFPIFAASANYFAVSVEGVKKTITTHFTLTTSAVTFTAGNIPAAGARIQALWLGNW